MGKPTGFMEWERILPAKRDKRVRLDDYREIHEPFAEAEAKRQGGRCMDCGVPFCHQGCPLGNPIPDFNEHIYRGHHRAAMAILATTNDFPEFTGRLCPAPCEASCVLAINRDPVTIEEIEKTIVERAFAEGWVTPRTPQHRTGRRVAVVGSGPAGLAAASQLNLAGHTVTVFEKADRIGGLLRYGIPDFKMEKWVIDRRLALLETEGVRFETGVDVGGAVPFDEIRQSHDALVLCLGARKPRDLDVPGRDLAGVVMAMDYLEQQNRVVAGLPIGERIDAAGKRVIILGGGDTGSDCLGTAHRQGAREVRQIELFPMPPSERAADNPWPQWPLVFRTSSSQEEGGERRFGLMTKELLGEGGQLRKLSAHGVELSTDCGRPTLVPQPGTGIELDVDLLILAMGFTGVDPAPIVEQLGVTLDPRGNIGIDKRFATSVDGVFAAGDASRGASLIVWAISDGREAARSVDTYLAGRPSILPSRGADLPFGGR